jgi:hypothetical protein
MVNHKTTVGKSAFLFYLFSNLSGAVALENDRDVGGTLQAAFAAGRASH